MAKVVVRNRRKVYETWEETPQERRDRLWLEKYAILLQFSKKFGHQRLPFDESSPNYKREYVQVQRWAVGQRRRYKNGELDDWKYKLLVNADFLFTPLDTYWNRTFEKLVEFKIINGHCNVSRYYEDDPRLGPWVSEQRYKKKKLSAERIRKLEEIGFDWGITRNLWDDMYCWLKDYYTEHGVAYVGRDLSNGYKGNDLNHLNRWCQKQINYFNKGKLPPDRLKLLKAVNFDFNHKQSKIETAWDKNFHKLKEFKEKYGHYNVPVHWEGDLLLSYWVQRQRVYKHRLTAEKRDKLDSIGFTWAYKDYQWENNYQLLVDFKKEYGHCKVLIGQDKKLHYWLRHMINIKRGLLPYQLTEYQIEKLDAIGVDWEPRSSFWEKCFYEFIEFKKMNGHSKVKYTKETKSLYSWCMTNRRNKSKLTEEKIQRLNEVGFEW